MPTTSLRTASHARLLAACVGAAGLLVVAAASGQTARVTSTEPALPGNTPPPARATVDPQTMSCNDLKAELKNAGQMSILSGPRGGWGDTFHGPAVPQCPFWQMPQFTYVKARDGLCGVGYICIDKYPMD